MTDAPNIEGPVPATGVFGVGATVAAISQVQLVFSVQFALRHDPPSHISPERQSAFIVQPLLQLAKGRGVGVDVDE